MPAVFGPTHGVCRCRHFITQPGVWARARYTLRQPVSISIHITWATRSRSESAASDSRGAEQAVDSWRRFGKGRHPAGLNFGDCCTHALASDFRLPILCVGDHFSRTDVPVVDLSLWGP